MLQGKNMVTPRYMYIFNPWIKSTPLGYGLLSRYVVNQIPQRIKSLDQNVEQSEEEEDENERTKIKVS